MLLRGDGFSGEDRRASLSRRLQAVAEIRRREDPLLPARPQAYGELRLVKLEEATQVPDAA